MTSITIHGLEDPLDSLIREKARRQGISLNKVIKQLLAESFGLSPKNSTHGNDFADLSGVWSPEDLAEFTRNTEELSDIDSRDWE
ncbi:MAG: hypothetical protein ACD_75C02579G0006 [uncultured bacterium]|nr:MAG: hypothetical protein ACD_75C02579G0006 [uncultured bacterium]